MTIEITSQCQRCNHIDKTRTQRKPLDFYHPWDKFGCLNCNVYGSEFYKILKMELIRTELKRAGN